MDAGIGMFQCDEKPLTPEDKALRDKLHLEIEKKSKTCSNPTFACSLKRVESNEFCLRHILQDPNAPYKQCLYMYPVSGKQCAQAAPKHDLKKDKHFSLFCFEHSRLSQLTKTRTQIGKLARPTTVDGHLATLTHYTLLDKTGAADDEIVDVEALPPLSCDPISMSACPMTF